MKKQVIAAVTVVTMLVAAFVFAGMFRANAAETASEPCVPEDAWTETIEHEAVTHVVHHEAVTHEVIIVDEEAYTETIAATPDLWWNWSPNDTKGPQDYEPAFPTDERGTWQGPHANGGPMQDTYGTFQTSAPGNSNWFHREHGAAEQVIEHPAVTHTETVIDTAAYDETVIDEEAYTETIDHPAVTCDEDVQPEPEVSETSSTAYACGDDFETVTTVVTTTEYVLVEGEWVLGEPVSETTTTKNPVEAHPEECTPDEPLIEEPNEPGEIISFQSFDGQGNLVEQRVSKPIPAAAQQEGM